MTNDNETPRVCTFGRIAGASPRHIEQFFGPWAISVEYADQFLARLGRMDMAGHDVSQRGTSTDYEMTEDGIAVIDVQGMMTKRGSSFSGAPGTIELRRQVSQAAASPNVRGIMLNIESPGGTAAGTKELADAVAQARTQKPVAAYIEDLGASAAYYVASQADTITANQPALVGSIGTFMVITDSSKMAEEMGVTVHVIKSGDFKGAGTPGTEITDEHLEYYQGLIDQIDTDFQSAVKSGRRMSDASLAAVANGKVFLAGDAKARGLVDSIGSFDQAMGDLLDMAEQNETPKAATLQELQSALVGADSDFLVGQLGANATLQEAQEAWIVEQSDRLTAAQAAAKEAEAKAEAAKVSVGVDPVGEAKATTGGIEHSARDEWNERIQKKVAGGMNRQKAASAVNRENPGLRAAMLSEVS